MIPFLDLKATYLGLKQEIDDAITHVVISGWFIGGPEVGEFEAEYATYCGANHAVGEANGFDALHFTLRAIDAGPGDEVIVPNTYRGVHITSHQGDFPCSPLWAGRLY